MPISEAVVDALEHIGLEPADLSVELLGKVVETVDARPPDDVEMDPVKLAAGIPRY